MRCPQPSRQGNWFVLLLLPSSPPSSFLYPKASRKLKDGKNPGAESSIPESTPKAQIRFGCRNRMQGWESVRWLVIGITLPENTKWFVFTKKRFMLFDRHEIHIQTFQEIPSVKLMSGNFSSSTFHLFQEFIISNYQNFKISKFQKSKNGHLMFPHFRIFEFRISSNNIFHFSRNAP